MDASELEKALQDVRTDENLRYRGAFLRRVCEMLSGQYYGHTKRLCIISDGAVFDYEDTDDMSFSAKEWYTLNQTERTEGKVALCPSGATLSAKVMEEHFATRLYVFKKVVLYFDGLLPLAWEPETGILECDEVGTRLTFELEDALHFRALIRLPAWERVKRITTTVEIVQQGEEKEFEIEDFVVAGSCPTLDLAESGCLSDEEFELWKRLCNSSHVKLMETSDMTIEEKPVFKTLRKMTGGYILLRKDFKEWQFFKTGIEVDGIAIVSVEGVPHWSPANGRLREMPVADDYFRLEVDDKMLYVLRV